LVLNLKSLFTYKIIYPYNGMRKGDSGMAGQTYFFTRKDVVFRSHDADCAGWLYIPETIRPAPIIIMAHGLGAVRDMRLDAYAERFCAAGYACLLFDYRCFGASQGIPRQLLDIKRQLADWSAAIAYARSCKEVDGSRIALFGSSFSGGHVITLAARYPEISAIVAQCPFTDGLASSLALSPWSALKVLGRAIADVFAGLLHLPPVLVDLAGNPGTTALMPVPDYQQYLALIPAGSLFRKSVSARIALQILAYYPGHLIKRIKCPAYYTVCKFDSVAPAPATRRHMEKAHRAEVHVYSCGHFEIYLGELFERMVHEYIAFLKKYVPQE